MYRKINPNPQGNYTGDCVVRAIAIAMDKTWYEVYVDLCLQGLAMADMPSSNRVWAEYLHNQGWSRHIVPDDCPACYTIRDFCGEFFKGTYLVGTGSHLVCIRNGSYMDSWDSGDESPIFYWKKEI